MYLIKYSLFIFPYKTLNIKNLKYLALIFPKIQNTYPKIILKIKSLFLKMRVLAIFNLFDMGWALFIPHLLYIYTYILSTISFFYKKKEVK